MMILRFVMILAVAALPLGASAQGPCPPGLEAVAGRCLPPELARVVREAPTIDGRAVEQTTQRVCCKTCRKGKPCGDSCISRDKECHKPPGCAC